MHTEANAEERHVLLAGIAHRRDLAFGAALAEAARHQNCSDAGQGLRRRAVLDRFGLDPLQLDLDLVGDATMRQRLD